MVDIESSIVNNKAGKKKFPQKNFSKKRKKKTQTQDKSQKQVKVSSTLQLRNDSEIALDFAMKAYKKFDKIIKSIVLFGSSARQTTVPGSDIDLIIVLDDAMVKWDQELIAWYREELDRILRANPYQRDLHINTIKLSTWWEDLMRGDPVIINVLRYGEPVLDMAGFFAPLKTMLITGKIKSTPEAIYSCLQRAPMHFARSKIAELNTIEGLYWAMVDSSQAALIAANISPASPEHIPVDLKDTFVYSKKLKMKYVLWYRDLLFLHKKIAHGEIHDLKGTDIDAWQDRTKDFMETMAMLVKDLVEM